MEKPALRLVSLRIKYGMGNYVFNSHRRSTLARSANSHVLNAPDGTEIIYPISSNFKIATPFLEIVMDSELKASIERNVLCWLATSTPSGEPNVSPKEVFTAHEDYIIIANIASPKTIKNIQSNANVCISFIDVFVQKGFQVKGKARIVNKDSPEFSEMEQPLLEITGGKFPFRSIT